MPFLIGAGLHASRDIPARIGLEIPDGKSPPCWGDVQGRFVACDTAIGGDRGISEIVLELALPGQV
jgi:hypothetical protein